MGKAVLRGIRPFAGILELEPLRGPGLEFKDLLTVEPMLHMTVVKNDLGGVPLTLGVHLHLGIIREVHRIVDTQFLPFLELRRRIDLLPALVIDQLILGSGHIRDFESGALHHMVQHAAVAAVGQLPIPNQLEVGILPIRDDIAGSVASVTGRLDAAVDDLPSVGQFSPVEITPAGHILSIEKELPSFRFFSTGQLVVLLTGANERHRRHDGHKQNNDSFHICCSLNVFI